VSLDNVDLEGIVLWLVVGIAAGWLASAIMKSKRGIVGYALLGIVGAVVGGFIFALFGLGGASNLIGQIIVATVGAVIILAIVGS
jgi:uncharacterized membrane protein YeaQ/YmgE (transglycosylase-associated protein family)